MNLDEMAKYLMWIIFFALVLTGLFFMLRKWGIL
jgi:hypothetical protein